MKHTNSIITCLSTASVLLTYTTVQWPDKVELVPWWNEPVWVEYVDILPTNTPLTMTIISPTEEIIITNLTVIYQAPDIHKTRAELNTIFTPRNVKPN